MYEFIVGPIPKGLLIRHLCHNKKCVNPSHLRQGTQKENMQDSVRDERIPYGEKNHRAKLKESEVKEIRRRKMLGESGLYLAEEYGVCSASIYRITNRTTWKHI